MKPATTHPPAQQPHTAAPQADDEPALQGEGNYTAARRHRKAAEAFVKSTDVEAAARDAAPSSEQEAQALEEAEAAGRSHAKR